MEYTITVSMPAVSPTVWIALYVVASYIAGTISIRSVPLPVTNGEYAMVGFFLLVAPVWAGIVGLLWGLGLLLYGLGNLVYLGKQSKEVK